MVMIANYFGKMVADYTDEAAEETKFPRTINMQFTKKQDMRYGENSHQDAAFYVENDVQEASVATAVQLQGKALSFNNIADTDAALECVKEFDVPACVIVKHANPCGVSIGETFLKPMTVHSKQILHQHLVALLPLTKSLMQTLLKRSYRVNSLK